MIFPRLYSKKDRADIVKRRLHSEGSRIMTVTITDLVAGAKKLYGFDTDSDIRKFLPLNFLRIINDSGCNLRIHVNQNEDAEVTLNNMIYTHDGDFYTFTLENLDGSATATGSTTYTTVQRKPGG